MVMRAEYLRCCDQSGAAGQVTGMSYPDTGAYLTTPEGEPLVMTQTMADGSFRHFYKHPLTGVLTMSTGNNVGVNPAAAAVLKTQFIGSFGGDWFADGDNLTLTTTNLIAAAVAAGVLVRKSDGTSRAALTTDFISRIDVDLKPIGGHVDVAGVQTPTTASDATHNRGGRVYDIDPGGSSQLGEIRDSNGFLVQTNTGDIVIKEGSGVVIAFDLASIPA